MSFGLKIKVKGMGFKSKEKMSNYYFASLLTPEKIQFSSPPLERRATPPQPNQHSALFTPDPMGHRRCLLKWRPFEATFPRCYH